MKSPVKSVFYKLAIVNPLDGPPCIAKTVCQLKLKLFTNKL